MRISDWSSDACSSDLLDLHDRLGQLRAGLGHALLERRPRRDLERQHAGVDVVVSAVEQGRLEVDHREPGHDAVVLGRLQALLDTRHVFARHRATDHQVLEDEALATLERLASQLDAGELAGPAGLLRSEEHTSELQSLMRTSYAVFCLKKTNSTQPQILHMKQ